MLVHDDAPELPADRFLNREVSWLDFNARVLALAEDQHTPLLERAKFLAIFASNLDEFYMVRVAGLKRRKSTGLSIRSADGLSVARAAGAGRRAHVRAGRAARALLPRGRAAGAGGRGHPHRALGRRWPSNEQDRLRRYFREQVFPVLTPLAVDPAHPFPYISGLSLNLAVMVRDPDDGAERFARVKVPNNVPRFVTAVDRRRRFLPIEDSSRPTFASCSRACRWSSTTCSGSPATPTSRSTRTATRTCCRRWSGSWPGAGSARPVRLEVADSMTDDVLDLLVRELDVDERDVLRVPGLLDLSSLWAAVRAWTGPTSRTRRSCRPPTRSSPRARPRAASSPCCATATCSCTTRTTRSPRACSASSSRPPHDPNVLAIKQTLYRTSGDSPIVDALIDAAEAGKQVVVLVEVKARFDEQANITWAQALERAGCHVVYGLVGLKTHCKTALVVRQEGGQIRRYCHIGTGNYNPKTARLYEDFGLFTADPDVGARPHRPVQRAHRLLAARRRTARCWWRRTGVRSRHHRADRARGASTSAPGGPALVQIKANSLVDEGIIDALYRASPGRASGSTWWSAASARCGRACRGCRENIRVRSILGRFLEHSRVFRFGNGGDDRSIWIGSADLMHRNLDRRVEAMVRVTDEAARAQLR